MLRPFLQDTIQWWPLTATMAGMLLLDPISVFRVVPQVGAEHHLWICRQLEDNCDLCHFESFQQTCCDWKLSDCCDDNFREYLEPC